MGDNEETALKAGINPMSEHTEIAESIPQIDEVDLSSRGVLQHFATSSQSAQLLNFLMALDRRDSWTVDFDEQQSPVALEVQAYLSTLARFVAESATGLHWVTREFVETLAHLKTTRSMYLMRYVCQRNPEFLEGLLELMQAESAINPNLAATRRRFEAFSRARVLGEMFSGERLRAIASIMENYTDD